MGFVAVSTSSASIVVAVTSALRTSTVIRVAVISSSKKPTCQSFLIFLGLIVAIHSIVDCIKYGLGGS